MEIFHSKIQKIFPIAKEGRREIQHMYVFQFHADQNYHYSGITCNIKNDLLFVLPFQKFENNEKQLPPFECN